MLKGLNFQLQHILKSHKFRKTNNEVFEEIPAKLDDNKTWSEVKYDFKTVFGMLENEVFKSCLIVIFIDGIDKTVIEDKSSLHILFTKLPNNVKIILSVDENNLKLSKSLVFDSTKLTSLEEIKKRYHKIEFVPISSINKENELNNDIIVHESFTAKIIEEQLAEEQRSLTREQLKVLYRTCKNFDSPYQILLCTKLTKDWTSNYTEISQELLSKTVGNTSSSCLRALIIKFENTFGKSLVRALCKFLYFAFPFGLTSQELQVLVCYDEEVENIINFKDSTSGSRFTFNAVGLFNNKV